MKEIRKKWQQMAMYRLVSGVRETGVFYDRGTSVGIDEDKRRKRRKRRRK